MKHHWLPVLLAAACTGCTAVSLERHTLEQIRVSRDYRAEEVLSCLATVAADRNTLPSFALIADGTTRVQDTANASSSTVWMRSVGSFGMETLGVTAARSPQGQWDIDPVVEHSRLEAIRCACLWVLYGPPAPCDPCMRLLLSPEQDPTLAPHFAVVDRLAELPHGWLHVGKLNDVPAGACHRAHCGNTWVWVMRDGMEGLSQFTLVLQDIATLDLAAIYWPPPLVTLTRDELTRLPDLTDNTGKKSTPITVPEIRAVKPGFLGVINQKIHEGMTQKGKVEITWAEWMQYTTPYHGIRTNVNPAGGLARPTPGQGVAAPSRTLPAVPINQPKWELELRPIPPKQPPAPTNQEAPGG